MNKWVGHIPDDIINELDTLAPMLKNLGYDTKSKSPNYGEADKIVLENMKDLKENADLWNAKAKLYERQPPNLGNVSQSAQNISNKS